MLAAVAALALLAPHYAHADLKKALAEPNLEKRSALALDNAADAVSAARKAYDAGDLAQAKDAIAEIGASVEMADRSLKDSGRDARKHPAYFKRAEIATRGLLRKIESFEAAMNYVDRPLLGELKPGIQAIHDGLLEKLLRGKK